MITPEEKQRIEKDGEKAVSANMDIDYQDENLWTNGYVSGALAEHPIARNKALDEAIDKVNSLSANADPIFQIGFYAIVNELKALKHKQS